MASRYLHIGDLVTVVFDDGPSGIGYLGSEGLATVQVGIREEVDPKHAEQNKFRASAVSRAPSLSKVEEHHLSTQRCSKPPICFGSPR